MKASTSSNQFPLLLQLLLPRAFGAKLLTTDMSPYPHLAPDDDESAYTVMVDNVPLVMCQDKSSAVTALLLHTEYLICL